MHYGQGPLWRLFALPHPAMAATASVERAPNAAPQASAKWRIMWRLAPRLLERWSETGRLNAINAAVTTTTKKVGSSQQCSRNTEAF